MSEDSFDVVVLGAGPAGEVCAGRLAQAGHRVAVVEPELVGGECAFWACMPSKSLLRPAQALAEARRIPGAAEAATGTLDVPAALARRDEVVHDFDDSSQEPWLDELGITLVRASGRLDGQRRVRAGDRTLTAERAVVVATGSASAMPPIDGLAGARPWTNREATAATSAPERLIVLGGGPVGVESAQAWCTLGSEVTLVESAEHVLSHEEPFAAEEVEGALREAGVDVRTGRRAERVARDGDGGPVTVTLDDGATVEGDELLVALGRTPRTDDIGLETVGLEAGGPIEVDAHLHVEAEPWLYAIGDVNGRALLTHQGKYQGRIAADHICGRHNSSLVYGGPLSPRVVFTEPQVASVGHTLAGAREAGIDARAVDSDVNDTAGASFYGKGVPGRARLVVDENRRVLVGATFTGADVADFLHAATIAVVGDVPIDRLWHAVPCFPTRSEVWLKLLEDYGM
jgi:pyruvate/2-oxoglutarate dehydrogenase complex dihydrolipoamide dehydrogenase (E3) component